MPRWISRDETGSGAHASGTRWTVYARAPAIPGTRDLTCSLALSVMTRCAYLCMEPCPYIWNRKRKRKRAAVGTSVLLTMACYQPMYHERPATNQHQQPSAHVSPAFPSHLRDMALPNDAMAADNSRKPMPGAFPRHVACSPNG